jgi:hypothetical protein
MALLHQGIMAPVEQPPTAPTATEPRFSFSSQRSRRQLGLFFAGAGFFAVTSLITRRSLVRRYKATIPKFYQSNNQPSQINGAVEAFEALNIATINVFSVAMMTVGGLLYAFDISSLEDMRRNVRTRLGVDATRADQEAEEEVEELFASILGRKLLKDKRAEIEKEIKAAKEAKDKEQKS